MHPHPFFVKDKLAQTLSSVEVVSHELPNRLQPNHFIDLRSQLRTKRFSTLSLGMLIMIEMQTFDFLPKPTWAGRNSSLRSTAFEDNFRNTSVIVFKSFAISLSLQLISCLVNSS